MCILWIYYFFQVCVWSLWFMLTTKIFSGTTHNTTILCWDSNESKGGIDLVFYLFFLNVCKHIIDTFDLFKFQFYTNIWSGNEKGKDHNYTVGNAFLYFQIMKLALGMRITLLTCSIILFISNRTFDCQRLFTLYVTERGSSLLPFKWFSRPMWILSGFAFTVLLDDFIF